MPRGRYAPSPTGELHLGNASSALLAWLSVRSRGGSFVMRMEDIDHSRVRPGLAEQILSDLEWLGIDWDEGSDRGGPHEPYVQSLRSERYDLAFRRLLETGRLYPCFCSRKEVAAAASAPQLPGDEVRYPGRCRGLDPAEAERRIAAGERHAFRFAVNDGAAAHFDDLFQGRITQEPPGDFVIRRSDGVSAYQLVVVVDDAEMEIDEVVRGNDLLASTGRQLLLYEALGHSPPRFGHVPLLVDTDGVRLSKRQQGITLRELRGAGFTAETIVGRLASMLGLQDGSDPVPARALVAEFTPEAIAAAPTEIAVDVGTW